MGSTPPQVQRRVTYDSAAVAGAVGPDGLVADAVALGGAVALASGALVGAARSGEAEGPGETALGAALEAALGAAAGTASPPPQPTRAASAQAKDRMDGADGADRAHARDDEGARRRRTSGIERQPIRARRRHVGQSGAPRAIPAG